jgi:anti-anti-sigma factor
VDFHARAEPVDGTVHVTIVGELDLASIATLQQLLGGVDRRHVVIDASGLTFIDVVGVSELLRCHRAVAAAGGSLVVRHPPAIFSTVLDALNLQDAVPMEAGTSVFLVSEHDLPQPDLERIGLTASLREVIDAVPPLFGVDGAGLMMVDEGIALQELASSDEPGRTLELLQQELGEGPCADTLTEDVVVATRDVRVDERWPNLGPRMQGVGVAAVLGVPTHLAGGAVGALNVYRSEPYEWTDDDVAALQTYNGVLERLIALAVAAQRHDELAQQLQTALDSRVVIERAIGLLMGRHGLEATEAFDRMRKAARSQRRRVYDLALDLLAGEADL